MISDGTGILDKVPYTSSDCTGTPGTTDVYYQIGMELVRTATEWTLYIYVENLGGVGAPLFYLFYGTVAETASGVCCELNSISNNASCGTTDIFTGNTYGGTGGNATGACI